MEAAPARARGSGRRWWLRQDAAPAGGGAMPSNWPRRMPLWVRGRSFRRLESTSEGRRGDFTGDRPWRAQWSAGAAVLGARRKQATLNRGAAEVMTA
jgi:hypothetical protein